MPAGGGIHRISSFSLKPQIWLFVHYTTSRRAFAQGELPTLPVRRNRILSAFKPTFPTWTAVCHQDRLILPVKQAFFALSGVCRRPNAWSSADHAVNPQHPGPAASFFSAVGRPVEPLSLSFSPDRGHAHSGGARNRRMAARMARTIGPVTATSASWKVMARA